MSQLGIGSSWLPLLSELSESPRQRRKHAVTTCNFLQQWQQQHQKQWFGYTADLLLFVMVNSMKRKWDYWLQTTWNRKNGKNDRKKKEIFRSDLWRLEWFWLFYYMLIIKVGTTNQCIPSQERVFVKGRSLFFRLPALLWILPLTSTLTYLLLFHFVWIYTQIFFLKIQITLHKIYFILCV